MNNLKKLREARGLSQQKLAEHFCLSQQSIYKYENNLAEPDFATLKQFADFFHTTVDYLIAYTDEEGTEQHNYITITPSNIKEAHHLELYRKLDPQSQLHLDCMLESIIDNDKDKNI